MKKCITALIFISVFLLVNLLWAQSSTLYVVTRSTKDFRLGKREFPSVGLFSTNDKGETWQHYGWYYTKCFSAATTTINNQRIFYLACGNGVQKSLDGGQHWILTSGWNITECLKVAIDHVNPQTVYTATAYGIFKTTDGGTTWEEKNRGLVSTFTPTVLIDKNDHNLLFCATESGIHRSRDGGEHWQPFGLLGIGIRTLIQHPQKPTILAAGTEDDGVFLSFDYGKTWRQKINGLTQKTIYALAFAPQDHKTIYAGTFRGGIFKSENAGDTWQAVNDGLGILDIHALIVDANNIQTVYAGTLNDGVWLSENAGGHWRFIGLETSQVWDMAFD